MSKEIKDSREKVQEKKGSSLEENQKQGLKGTCKGCHRDCNKCTCEKSNGCSMNEK